MSELSSMTEARRELFLSKIKKQPSGCWEWQGQLNGMGYGRFRFAGKNRLAHRLAVMIDRNDFGLLNQRTIHVCHQCDNRRCVRPSHLFLGSARDNMIDAGRKGALGTYQRGRASCAHGHEFTKENTIVRSKTGWRACRICRQKSEKLCTKEKRLWRHKPENRERVLAIRHRSYKKVLAKALEAKQNAKI